jgi:short-subunit dehydrogenase
MTNIAAVSSSRPVALITGASAGIGLAFAQALAERGYDLIVTARRRERLEELATGLRVKHAGIRVEIIVADLAEGAAPEQIAAETARLGMTVELLVNNAGFGTHGRFESIAPDREREEIALNVAALVALTHAFLPAMLERGRGGVINIASTAAFQPVPWMSVYGATKAFVRSFSEALHEEVYARGVRVLALCPGPTATEFFDTAVAAPRGPIRTVRDVVATGLRAYDKGVPLAIDGPSNQIVIRLASFMPRRWTTKIAGRIMHP